MHRGIDARNEYTVSGRSCIPVGLEDCEQSSQHHRPSEEEQGPARQTETGEERRHAYSVDVRAITVTVGHDSLPFSLMASAST